MQSEKEVGLDETSPTPLKSLGQSILEFAGFALIAIAVVVPVRVFIAQPFIVSGASMVPTFEDKDYLIVDELSYRLGGPQRLDVVIFKYPKDTTKFFIKRIIGLPNETVDIKGETITITNNENKEGFKIDQAFIKNLSSDEAMHFELGKDEYFVMGDNRNARSDSRYWGPVKKDLLVGRAFLRLLPISDIDLLPGSVK